MLVKATTSKWILIHLDRIRTTAARIIQEVEINDQE
jgi:hypothetical protein